METLSWARIESRLQGATPWVLSIGGTRGVGIGYEPYEPRLYVRVPADAGTLLPAGAYAEIDVELRSGGGNCALEISTASSRYFREFHGFATLIAEEYEREGQTALGAFRAAIQAWQGLLSRHASLSEEQQIGLFGELLLLEGLVRERGPEAVDAWIGRESVGAIRHDFRVGQVDLEVKTTRAATRAHIIHGLRQLVPAEGHTLYLISIRLEPAGADAGISLKGQVEALRSLVGKGAMRESFERKLDAALYRDADALLYQDRLILSDTPMLIRIDEKCPRIIPKFLESNLPPDALWRVDRVSYEVNVEGMGVTEGSPAYQKVLGHVKLGT